jgi:uncharacterized protein YbjT (DUF2867 family)
MITVFGATGNTGGAVAATLLKLGKKVRVVGRKSDKLAALVKAGAEAAVGDIEDGAFVQKAMQGAEAAYVLIPPNLGAADLRAYQMRVVETVTAAIAATKLGHVVLLSSIGAHLASGTGPIVGVHTFEQKLNQIPGLNALFVRAGFFMENVFMGLHGIKAEGIYSAAMPAEAAVPMIAASDIGVYVAGRLARLDFKGKSAVHLLGPQPVSQTELVATLGKAIGKPVRYVQISIDDVAKGMAMGGLSASVIAAFTEMMRAAGEGKVAPEEGGAIEHGATTFATFTETVFAPAYRA